MEAVLRLVVDRTKLLLFFTFFSYLSEQLSLIKIDAAISCEKNEEKQKKRKKDALAGNRTRVARVASEHSTTEPPVLEKNHSCHASGNVVCLPCYQISRNIVDLGISVRVLIL